MKGFAALAFAATILSTNALNLAPRVDGQAPKVVQHQIQRRETTDPSQSIQNDRRRMQKRQSLSVSIQNEETLYYMLASVGTPAQSIRFHLDTGSSDLWANVASSRLCEGSSQCSASGTYNANDSSTYTYLNSEFNISYVDGSGSSGDYATDTVAFAGVTLENQEFGIGYVSSSYESIIGIGYPSNEVAASLNPGRRSYANVPESLVNSGTIATNAYSLWLDDLASSTGTILFGGVNTARYTGTLETLPVIQEAGIYLEFIIALTGVGANGTSGSIASNLAYPALLDSGSSLMYLPDDIAQTIYDAVGAQYDDGSGNAYVDCSLRSSDYTVDLTFSSPTISIAMSELVILYGREGGQNVCILGIAKAGGSTELVLGDTFLRSAYVVYDIANNEISLAQTNFDGGSDSIIEITSSSGVPGATAVPNAVTSVSGASDGTVSNDNTSAGSHGPSAALSFNLLAVGVLGTVLLLVL